MKKIFLILFVILSICGFVFSQKVPEFKLTKDGIKPIVIEFDAGYTDSVIYTRIKEWILLNYKSPKSVTRIDNENVLIKFSYYTKDGWKTKINDFDYWYDLQYTFTVEIKDFKCRITFDSEESRYKFWYNENGSLKENFKESESTFQNSVNKTLTSLYNYIIGNVQKETDDW